MQDAMAGEMVVQGRSNPSRIVQLDALRGLAAMAVVLFHFTTKFRELYAPSAELPFEVSWGHYGVNLFFIISGFVIFMTLSRSRDWRDFVVSRFSRLYPAYWFAVALTFTVVAWLGLPGKEVGLADAVLNLLMFQSWLKVPSVDGVYWTLLIELHFYVLALLLFVFNRIHQWVRWIWLLFLLRLTYRLSSQFLGVDLPYIIQLALILDYIPWFALGISAYFLVERTSYDQRSVWITVVGALALILLAGGWKLLLIAMACFAAVLLAARGRLVGSGHPILVWLGAISYTLYLLHENIGWAVMRQMSIAGFDYTIFMPLVLILVLALAWATTVFVERPSMSWIRIRYKAGKRRSAL